MEPSELPIRRYADDIARAVRDNAVVVVIGETGSGKTTQISQILLDAGLAGDRMVGVTQPRRVVSACNGMGKEAALALHAGLKLGGGGGVAWGGLGRGQGQGSGHARVEGPERGAGQTSPSAQPVLLRARHGRGGAAVHVSRLTPPASPPSGARRRRSRWRGGWRRSGARSSGRRWATRCGSRSAPAAGPGSNT